MYTEVGIKCFEREDELTREVGCYKQWTQGEQSAELLETRLYIV